LDDKLALGIVEVDILLKNKEKLVAASDAIRQAGYTVNNYLTRGMGGERRYNVEVVLKRNEMSELERILKDCDVNNPTLKMKPVSKVTGKITTSKLV